MKKSDKIQEMLRDLPPGAEGVDPRYAGYFACFNAQQYYEAHDVLEDLWLETRDGDYAFYKGLIQLAGAYVHLQKQYLRPDHAKDGVRARPAVRLFELAAGNLAAYRPRHLRLNVAGAWSLCTTMAESIARKNFSNPWSPQAAPTLHLENE